MVRAHGVKSAGIVLRHMTASQDNNGTRSKRRESEMGKKKQPTRRSKGNQGMGRTRTRAALSGLQIEALEERRVLSVTIEGMTVPGDPSTPHTSVNFTNVNGVTFFTGSDTIPGNNEHSVELWKSTYVGTGNGNSSSPSSYQTEMVKDIWPGTSPSIPEDLTNVDGTLFFTADDGTDGRELWKSDGTTANTVMVKDINPNGADGLDSYGPLTAVGNLVYFVANDGTNGNELWVSNGDGSNAGTHIVADINSGAGSSVDALTDLVNVNGELFFAANDGIHGVELWKTDGTALGTMLVKDIANIAAESSYPFGLANINGRLFFSASDPANGHEQLWTSEGTAASTLMLKEFLEIHVESLPGVSHHMFTNLNGIAYFAANEGTTGNGMELWESDGTVSQTFLVKNIRPEIYGPNYPYDSSPADITNVGGTLYFSANDGTNGIQLWQSDGTGAGTSEVANLLAVALTNVNGNLFFAAVDPNDSKEKVFEYENSNTDIIYSPSISGSENYLTNINGALFFNATEYGYAGGLGEIVDGTSNQHAWTVTKDGAQYDLLMDGVSISNSTSSLTVTTVSPEDSVLIDNSNGEVNIPVTVYGDGGTLTIDDSSDSSSASYTVAVNTYRKGVISSTAFPSGGVTYWDSFSQVNLLMGSNSADVANVQSTNRNVAETAVAVGGSNQGITLGVSGTVSTIKGPVTLVGASGSSLVMDDTSVAGGGRTYDFTPSVGVTGFVSTDPGASSTAVVNYSAFNSVTLKEGGGVTTTNVGMYGWMAHNEAPATALNTNNLTILGGSGGGTFNVNTTGAGNLTIEGYADSSSDPSNTFNVDGTTSGTTTLDGGEGADTFNFGEADDYDLSHIQTVSVNGDLHANQSNNTINLWYNTAVGALSGTTSPITQANTSVSITYTHIQTKNTHSI